LWARLSPPTVSNGPIQHQCHMPPRANYADGPLGVRLLVTLNIILLLALVATLFVVSDTNDTPLNVRDFGARGDGMVDDTAAFRRAIAAGGMAGRTILFPAGTYRITDTVPITEHRTHLRGEDIYTTRILFSPQGERACFAFEKPGSVLYQCSVQNIAFIGEGMMKKTAIRAVDTSEFVIRHVVVHKWRGNTSIGFQLHGRELTVIDCAEVFADRPISIEKNPHIGIDCDHLHMSNLYLSPQKPDEPCVAVGADLAVTSFIIDGYNAFVGGKSAVRALGGRNSFYWNFSNIRYEQGSDATGYAFDITGVRTVHISGTQAGTATHGFRFRDSSQITLTNCTYENSSGKTALDANSSVDHIYLCNTHFKAGSVEALEGIEEIFSIGTGDGIRGLAHHRWLQRTSRNDQVVRIHGTTHWQKSITLRAGARDRFILPLPGLFTQGVLTITAYSQTDGIHEGGTYALSSSGVVRLAGTAQLGVGNLPNHLTVFFENRNTISLLNQLANAPTVQVLADLSYTEAPR
jgi:hypothetical protein